MDFESLFFVFLLSAGINFVLVSFSEQLGLVDVPNGRSAHASPTPRSGGIAIVIALTAGVGIHNLTLLYDYPLLFAGLFAVFAVGLADDRFGMRPRMKFLIIFAATALAYLDGFGIAGLGHYFGMELSLGWMAFPFTLFAVAGFTNALNLIDGIDMLSATVSSIILLTLAYLGFVNNDPLLFNLSMASVAAVGGFLLFNVHPAKIFMGDSGALSLGFLISMLSIRALEYVEPTVILFITTVPILDTLIVMIRRIRRGISPFTPDKTHLHHIIMRQKRGNVFLAVAILASIQLSFSLIGLQLIDNESFVNLVIFFLTLFVFYSQFTVHRKKRKCSAVSKEVTEGRKSAE